MVEKDSGVYIGTRIPPEFKDEIEARFVGKDKEHQTMSDFLRALILACITRSSLSVSIILH